MAQTTTSDPLNLAFLAILRESGSYLGGYLVTNLWGRPLEFRLTTAVQPNRIQQILYGSALEPYICADLIGKTLLDKTATPAGFIFTDSEAALELRRQLDFPVAWVPSAAKHQAAEWDANRTGVSFAAHGPTPVVCHPRFAGDAEPLRDLLVRLESTFDLKEPFARIHEAMSEARKMGATHRN